MNIVRKDAEITNTGSDDEFPGTFDVVLSTATKDRDGDELKSEDWEQPLPGHITFDTDHGMTVAATVGSGVPSLDDAGRLVVSGSYSSLTRAQEARTLVKEGHIRTVSVAFLTKKVSKGGQTKTVRELLNGAFVAIPSNTEAVVLASKAADMSAPDPETAPADAVGVKTVAGSYEQRQSAISDALDAAYPDPPANGYIYAYPLATFDDKVVYRVSGDTDDRGQWQASYTVADDGTVTLGQPERVTMVETVVPVNGTVPKGFRLVAAPTKNVGSSAPAGDATTGTDDSAAAATPAAPSAADDAAAAEDLAASEVQVRAARIRAMAAAASIASDEGNTR